MNITPSEFCPIHTYTGRMFYPFDPKPEDISIIDIAHGLSNICRYSGQCYQFLSVAEHCINVSLNCPTYPLWGLLHDASEAYIIDLPRPVKSHLPGYKKIEKKIMRAICEKFNLPFPEPKAVKSADNRVLATEMPQLFYDINANELGPSIEGLTLKFMTPRKAEEAFLKRFFNLVSVAK
jgi:hypothetical protein